MDTVRVRRVGAGNDALAMRHSRQLKQLLLLSVAAAIITISLKTTAWLLTGSVGLLSDAAESLAAALIALGAVHWASLPPDEEHTYGQHLDGATGPRPGRGDRSLRTAPATRHIGLHPHRTSRRPPLLR